MGYSQRVEPAVEILLLTFASRQVAQIHKEFHRAIFYLGQLVFENDRFYYRILHNETAFAIQRRLQFAGLQAIVLPIRVLNTKQGLKQAS